MSISNLEVGTVVDIDLLVAEASIKVTRSNKKYLSLVLADGKDKINAVKWNWDATSKPSVNTVLQLTAEVTEWSGVKQLNIKELSLSTKSHTAFAPVGPEDFGETLNKWHKIVDRVANKNIKTLLQDIFNHYKKDWSVAPAASGVHHAYLAGNMVHAVSTALIAEAIAKSVGYCNVDLCIAGGLLHDIGKLNVYKLTGSVIEYSTTGHMFEHIIEGIQMLEPFRTPSNTNTIDILQHIIASHHGKLEYGSPVTPKCVEALIVSHADDLDAKIDIMKKLNKEATDKVITDKHWVLDNQPLLRQSYISNLILKDYRSGSDG